MLGISLAALTAASTLACPTGLFEATAGKDRVVITSPSGSDRYTFIDGRRGAVEVAGSPLTCANGKLLGRDGAKWSPVAVRTTKSSFDSHGTKLVGTLIEPTTPGPHP